MVDRLLLKRKDKWMQEITCIDQRIIKTMPVEKYTILPKSFQPDNWSVICGRGKDCFDNIGNRRLKVLAQIHLKEFVSTKSKMAKSLLIMRIVDTVRESSQAGGFLTKNRKTGRWYEAGDSIAREKVSSELRIALKALQESGQHQQGEETTRTSQSKQAISSSLKRPHVTNESQTKNSHSNSNTEPIVFGNVSTSTNHKMQSSEPFELMDNMEMEYV